MSAMCLYALNSRQLLTWLMQQKQTAAIFGGVFCRDTLPTKIYKPTLYVVNTAKHSHRTGIHWVAIFTGIPMPEYFDSLGRTPPPDFWPLLGPRYIYNKTRVQSLLYPTCGYYCLFYAACRAGGTSFDDIIREMKATEDCAIARSIQQIHPLSTAGETRINVNT